MSGVVVDTSAAVAILLAEEGSDAILDVLDGADERLLSAASAVELGIVFEARFGPAGASVVERFIRDGGIQVVSFSRTQADRAIEGWRRFGRGRHPAGLNLGDCFTYGLAVDAGCAVLCTGDDFARTDVDVEPA